jgi:peptidoglycan hydrolase CwlO-like protein
MDGEAQYAPYMQYLIPAVVSLITTLGAAYLGGWWVKRKTAAEAEKQEAEATEIVKQTVLSLIEPLNKRIKDLQSEVNGLRKEVDQLGRRNKSLWRYIEKLLDVIKRYRQQLIDHQLIPCVEPPDWVEDEIK